MRFIHIAQVAGRICRLFGAAFAAPAAVAAFYGEWTDIPGFVLGGVVSGGIGQTLLGISRGADDDLRRIEALSVVAGVWLLFAVLCSIPYLWVGFGAIDALFEAMSGITATGATILTDFESPGRGLFFWRALTQWIGGMGVITLVVAVLPRLAVGVRQLFFAEAPGPTEEKLAPQIRKTAASLWRLYAGLTAAEVVALGLAGMPWFDAVCHAMTTLAAGGFSPHAQSIMGYESALIEERNQAVAAEQLRLATEQYRVGSASFLDLVEAETVKAQADRERVASIYAYHDLLANLEALVGARLRP